MTTSTREPIVPTAEDAALAKKALHALASHQDQSMDLHVQIIQKRKTPERLFQRWLQLVGQCRPILKWRLADC